MIEQSGQRLERIANLTSLAVAALFALTIPAGYFIVGYSLTKQMIQDQADVSADTLSEMIYQQPDFWVYQEHRLIDMIEVSNWLRSSRNYIVFNSNYEVIVKSGQTLSKPHLSVEAELSDGEKIVGSIRVIESMMPLLRTTFLVSLVGAMLAWLVHYLLKVLPFAALRRVMSSLDQSKQHLLSEVEAKQKALADATALSERMRHQALHDSLTSLPNRAYFNEYATSVLRSASPSSSFAVMLLDLNRFKEINDSLGHHVGDTVLKQVSLRFKRLVDEDIFLARLGGDEFAFLASVDDCTQAMALSARINKCLHQHIVIDDHHIAIQGCIGVACYPQHGTSMSELLRRADVAMYQAKASGELVCIYQESLDTNSPSQLTLAADLRHALDMDELYLVYQPKVNLSSGKLVGVEALLRWNHNKIGLISPDMFIALAEAGGMINDLTKMVLTKSLRQLSTWRSQGIEVNLAINISARNLHDDSMVPHIKKLATEYKIMPSQLTLEITESNIMVDPDRAQQQVSSLSSWGAKIAVDDYGTGYSSLAYLSRLAVDELKIDKSFVFNMLDNNEDCVIVRSTIEMAHNLGLTVVAEGIENQETADLLCEYGCELGQGYHYCRPIDPDQLFKCITYNGRMPEVTQLET